MSWRVDYSSQAAKFIQKNPPHVEGVKECLKLFIKKLSGETVSLDIKKMKGTWQDSLRIRKGDIRIIFSINENEKIIHVNVIDFRGDVYK